MKWSTPENLVWRTKCDRFSIERVGKMYDLRQGQKLVGRYRQLAEAKNMAHQLGMRPPVTYLEAGYAIGSVEVKRVKPRQKAKLE